MLKDLKGDPDCPKCKGKGHYHYDHNHGKPCELCCKHDEGWWDLSPEHHGDAFHPGEDNGCCRAGCGIMRRDLPKEKDKDG